MSELPKEHRTVSTEAIVRVGEGRDCEFVDDDTIAALKARLAKAAASGWGNSTYQSPDEWLPQWLASQRRRDFEKWQSRVSHPELEVEGADAAKPARKRRSPKPMLASVAKQVSRAGIEVARYEVKPTAPSLSSPARPAPNRPTTSTTGLPNMRILVKGINSVTKRLADGTRRTYWYAWKGGPPLRGKPGTPEFIASYNEAVAKKMAPPTGVLLALLFRFQESAEFQFGISPRTRRDYIKQIKRIERAFGDFPIKALDDPRARSVFLEWRDKLAQTSLRQADYAYGTLARILSWAHNRGLIAKNPCAKGGKLYHGTRVNKIWNDEDVARFLRTAPPYLRLAMLLAINTGQRQGDLLRLPWSAYDGTHIKTASEKNRRISSRSRSPTH